MLVICSYHVSEICGHVVNMLIMSARYRAMLVIWSYYFSNICGHVGNIMSTINSIIVSMGSHHVSEKDIYIYNTK